METKKWSEKFEKVNCRNSYSHISPLSCWRLKGFDIIQNDRMMRLEGASGDHIGQPPDQSLKAGISRLSSVGLWISPRTEITKHFWLTCLISLTVKIYFLMFKWMFYMPIFVQFIKLHKTFIGPFTQPFEVSLDGSPTIFSINDSSQFYTICKLAEGAQSHYPSH